MNIHDNIIKSYTVDLENKQINFRTYSRERSETVDFCFKNVLAHRFCDETEGSILFDITKQDIDTFIKNNKDLLLKKQSSCWPTSFSDIPELKNMLIEEAYQYYILYSSFGLNGWVLAKSYEKIG